MTSQPGSANPTWVSTIPATLLRWWWLALIPAVLGGYLGHQAGGSSPRTATALIRVNSTATEGQVLTRLAQTAVLESSTSSVFNTAAKARKTNPTSLRTRSRVTNVPDSLVVSIETTAPTAKAAAADANAIATAAVNASKAKLTTALEAATEQTKKLITDGKIRPRLAENARVGRLGDLLGERQNDLTKQGTQLTIIQLASPTQTTGNSATVFAALGAAAGLMLGVGLALAIGSRRGRLRSLRKARRLYPDTDFTPIPDVEYVLGAHKGRYDRVVIASPKGKTNVSGELVEAVSYACGDDTEVVVAPMNRLTIRETARDPRALLILELDRKTKVRTLDDLSQDLNGRTLVTVPT